MRYKDILSRITGFSVPVFGVSWNPPEPEAAVARRVLTFLEDRRVLYNPAHLEVVEHCIRSVLEIRQFLTEIIGDLNSESKLTQHLRAVRAACRRFLDDMGRHPDLVRQPYYEMSPLAASFLSTPMGELRATVGLHIAAIAVMYGLDVEGDLARILPVGDKSDV